MLSRSRCAGHVEVYWLAQSGAPFARDLDFVEYFAGIGTLAASMSEVGLATAVYDRDRDGLWEDLLTKQGIRQNGQHGVSKVDSLWCQLFFVRTWWDSCHMGYGNPIPFLDFESSPVVLFCMLNVASLT